MFHLHSFNQNFYTKKMICFFFNLASNLDHSQTKQTSKLNNQIKKKIYKNMHLFI
jgi:hypothetical protein